VQSASVAAPPGGFAVHAVVEPYSYRGPLYAASTGVFPSSAGVYGRSTIPSRFVSVFTPPASVAHPKKTPHGAESAVADDVAQPNVPVKIRPARLADTMAIRGLITRWP